jgi:hypothetical protein
MSTISNEAMIADFEELFQNIKTGRSLRAIDTPSGYFLKYIPLEH